MKKIFFSLFLFIVLTLFNPNVVAKTLLPLDNLQEYNIRLISQEQGVSTYSGAKDGIQLKIMSEADDIIKVILVFDFDDSGAKRSAYAMDTIKIVSNLMPQKIESQTEAQDMLYKKLAAMKTKRDTDVFTLNGLRFECNCNNGMINIRVTK